MGYGLIRNEVLLGKIETSYGVDPTPVAATNAMLVRGAVDFGFDRLRFIQRPVVKATLGPNQGSYGGTLKALRIEVECKGSGAAGTPPEFGPLLRACGLGETIVASTSVTYAPVSTGFESVTMYLFEFGRVRHIVSGCRGGFGLRYQAGDLAVLSFELLGKPGTVTDQTQPAPTYNATVPKGVLGMDTRIGGVAALLVQNYELASGNEISVSDNVNSADGYGDVLIGDRDPTITLSKHAELIATHNPWADLEANTARAFVSGSLGATAGNIVNLNGPQMHYRNITPGEDQNVRVQNYNFGLHEAGAGDNQFSIVFT